MIGWVLAAQIAIVARGPDTATACQPIELAVAARTAGAVAPRISLPAASDLQLLRATFASRTERDAGGRLSTLTEGTLVVATGATGHLAIPLLVDAGGSHGRASPIAIDVRENPSPSPIVMVRARLDAGPARRTDSLFVGQQVDYVVDVQLNEPARQRLRRNPTFFPPEMPAVLAYDLPAPTPITREGRHCFESLSYHRALFPLFPGAVSIAPATLAYSLPLSTSFFSREESYELRTDSVRFIAVEPPTDGRPADYAGAVGNVRARATLSAASARMGDPLVLTLRLEGSGNVKLLPRPVLTIGWASIALGEERVTVDSSAPRVRGTKEFDWLLTPRAAGRQSVPAIRYPFFDPDRGGYDVSVADSIPVDVASASLASADTATFTRLPIRTTLRAERPPSLPSRPWYWALLLAAPAPAALRRLRVRGRRRRGTTHSPLGRLRALARARTPPPAHELRRAFLDALRARVPVVGEWTASAPISLGRTLRRAGVTDATAQAAESLLGRLDLSAFAGAPLTEPDVAAKAVELAIAVDREALRTVAFPPRGAAPALVLLLVASSALYALPAGVERAFHDGVLAYDRSDWSAAQHLFGRVAARTPRAVDAWANLGTAAWAANDTAHAMLGWQRALRLDPLDTELRDRIALVQSPSVSAPGYVPPVPVDAAAAAALALWVGAWLLLALPANRRPARARALFAAATAVAIASLAVTAELNDRSGMRGLVALRGSRELLDAPDPTASAAATASAGEIGALGAREGAWVRISLDDARAGWLPAAAVVPLDEPPGAD